MIAEFMFTVTESKYLIAKAVVNMKNVKKAFKEGIIALHPSTSTYFVMKELTGTPPSHEKVWITGMVVPKGMCVEAHTQVGEAAGNNGVNKALADAGSYPHTLVIQKGKVVTGWVLNDLIENMGEGDIYLKGVNAIDINKKVAVQIGSMDGSGTIGRMVGAAHRKGFEIICPTGYEKLVPVSVDDAATFVNAQNRDYSMGVKSKLFPFNGTVITEKGALEMLTGVSAMPFASGGLAGAEGAVCIAVNGSEEQVLNAIKLAESVKGVTLPDIHSPNCMDCSLTACHLFGTKKSWIK